MFRFQRSNMNGGSYVNLAVWVDGLEGTMISFE